MPIAKSIDPTAAELELKRRGRRRLVGAATIGVVAVVVLPMIFDSEPKRTEVAKQQIEVQIPPKEGLPPLAAPVSPPAAAQSGAAKASVDATPAVNTALAPVDTATKAEPSKPAPKPEPKSEPKLEPKPEPKSEPKSAAKVVTPSTAKAPDEAMSGFVIQLGAFKDADNAKAVVTRMQEAKLPVFTDTIQVKSGSVVRVRVGPFASKDKAEGALAQVKLAGIDGKIVPLP